MPPASVLSPLAAPFTPSREGFTEFASFGAIYIDGIPEGVWYGDHAAHDIIHNIPDEAIDEIFPPSAADAAELDATDDFLATMVDLSFLEECEELTRSDYGHWLKKRWEARRQRGLIGKPYKTTMSHNIPAATSLLNRHGHAHTMPTMSKDRRLVHFNRHHRVHNQIENQLRWMEEQKHAHRHSMYRNVKKVRGAGMVHGPSKPIQQPRKMN